MPTKAGDESLPVGHGDVLPELCFLAVDPADQPLAAAAAAAALCASSPPRGDRAAAGWVRGQDDQVLIKSCKGEVLEEEGRKEVRLLLSGCLGGASGCPFVSVSRGTSRRAGGESGGGDPPLDCMSVPSVSTLALRRRVGIATVARL